MWKWLSDFFKPRLPVGRAEFDKWAGEVIALTPLPDNRSTRTALATMIMHRDQKEGKAFKRSYAQQLIKGAANEVAHALFCEEQEKKKAEARKEMRELATNIQTEHPDKAKDETFLLDEIRKTTGIQNPDFDKHAKSIIAEFVKEQAAEVTPAGVTDESKETCPTPSKMDC